MINSVQHSSWLHFISYLKEREREIENGEESTKKDRLAVSRNGGKSAEWKKWIVSSLTRAYCAKACRSISLVERLDSRSNVNVIFPFFSP